MQLENIRGYIDALFQRDRDLSRERDRRYAEMFRAMERGAEERDLRYEQRFQAAQTALTAAMAAQEKAVKAALEAADRAVSKAETATEKRFEAVNEFRSSLNDLIDGFRATISAITANLMPRTEALPAIASVAEKVAGAVSRLDKLEGRDRGVGGTWSVAAGALGLLATGAAVVIALISGRG